MRCVVSVILATSVATSLRTLKTRFVIVLIKMRLPVRKRMTQLVDGSIGKAKDASHGWQVRCDSRHTYSGHVVSANANTRDIGGVANAATIGVCGGV
jgi:hypothetical protein